MVGSEPRVTKYCKTDNLIVKINATIHRKMSHKEKNGGDLKHSVSLHLISEGSIFQSIYRYQDDAPLHRHSVFVVCILYYSVPMCLKNEGFHRKLARNIVSAKKHEKIDLFQ